MVQEILIINEAVVPVYPTIPNPYVILGGIPPSAQCFTIKDAFFCIPLAKESQYLFAFKWEDPGEKQQMTWTVFPQGLRDSPNLFGKALSQNLLDLDLGPNGKILQYEDDLLICSPHEKNAQKHTIQVLNLRGDIKSPVQRHRWSRQRSLTWEFRLHTDPGGCPLTGYKESSSCPPP